MAKFTLGGNDALVQVGGFQTTPVAAATSADTVIKNGPGVLHSVLLTTAGTNPINIYDNASGHAGTLIGVIPAAATVDGKPYVFNMPAAAGITIQGNAGNGAVTVSFS